MCSGASPSGRAEAARGRGTILFVDDEPMLRSLGGIILQRQGYEVLLAEDGLRAVELYQREKGRIDLVVLDLTVPRLSGRSTFERLLQIDPHVSVLLSSGHPDDHAEAMRHERVLGFIGKPYRAAALVQLVEAALEKARHPVMPCYSC